VQDRAAEDFIYMREGAACTLKWRRVREDGKVKAAVVKATQLKMMGANE
jgi:hypothetical protein